MDHDAASDTPASVDERVEDFAEFLDRMDEENNALETAETGMADESVSTAAPDDAEAQADAPVSWDKDAKALFAQLPPELQEQVAAREAQRERALQSASQAAADARRNAAVEAGAAFADQQRLYAAQLEQMAAQLAPRRPDPALLAQDPHTFYRLQAQFESQAAQADSAMRAAAQAQAEAQQHDSAMEQHMMLQDHAALSDALGGEWADATQRQALLGELEEVGLSLGYSMDLMSQAGAADILALKAAADWKAKAERYDALQSGRSSAVKAARAAPRMARPGTSPSRAEQTGRGRDAAWTRAKTERSGEAYAAMLDSMGISL